MRWIIPIKKQDQEIRTDRKCAADEGFNAPLAENDGGVATVETEADDDIRAGRVKRFDNPEDMIASLKRPWED